MADPVLQSPTAGQKAPEFRLPSLSHGDVGPQDYAGRLKLLVAFYPRDNTVG